MKNLLDRLKSFATGIDPEYYDRKRRNKPLTFLESRKVKGLGYVYNDGKLNFKAVSSSDEKQVFYNKGDDETSTLSNRIESINWVLTRLYFSKGLKPEAYAIVYDENMNAEERRVTIKPLKIDYLFSSKD
jgi:hypothetical protein